MKDSLAFYFAALDDPRYARNQRHPLSTLIGTSLLAALCGIDSFSGMQDFAKRIWKNCSAISNFRMASQAMTPTSGYGITYRRNSLKPALLNLSKVWKK